MRKNRKRILSVTCALLMSFSMIMPAVTADSYVADNDDNTLIVVSMGDSYSSGEGIEPFYGQGTAAKIYDADWLAHRSEKSWPGQLTFSEIKGHQLSEYKNAGIYSPCQWFFVASSGAETKHVLSTRQPKIVRFTHPTFGYLSNDDYLPLQIDVFDSIEGKGNRVDYVTMSIGGNDVKFADIITDCVKGTSYLHHDGRNKRLDNRINKLWENIETTKKNISDVYTKVLERAPNAEIIVAGYPELLNYDGKGTVISEQEALTVNKNVRWFNDNLEGLVDGCNDPRIHFVSVEEAFEGHQAYSEDQWINEIKWGPCSEDLKSLSPASSYSIHPNEKGAKAYADCVNEAIESIEKQKETGGDPNDQGGTITDSWDQIIASCNDGTYREKYKIGDTKALDLGTEGVVEMQIAAFDADELADGSGKAAITWISKQLLRSEHIMNPARQVNSEKTSEFISGTGTIDGWKYSEMRKWLYSEIFPLIQSNVRNDIKPVKKYSYSINIYGQNINNEVTTDQVWIPSIREVVGGAESPETEGPTYLELFASDTNKVKQKNGSSENCRWWLRSARYNSTYVFRRISETGNNNIGYSEHLGGVALGFCI